MVAVGRNRDAAAILKERPYHLLAPTEVLLMMEQARIAEHLDEREDARRGYSAVALTWRNADPELQPIVAEALAGLKRLEGEPTRATGAVRLRPPNTRDPVR